MKYFIRVLLLIAAGAGLTGCASSGFQDTVFAPSTAKIHTIGLLTIMPPPGFSIFHAMTAGELAGGVAMGMLVGPGGSAIALTNHDQRENSAGAAFTRAIETDNYHIETNLTDALARDLRNEGYKVVFVNAPRPPYVFMTAYPHVPGVDAYLDVYFHNAGTGYPAGAGYVKYFRSPEYYAYMHIAARLVGATDGKVLYARQTIYSSGDLSIGINFIKSDPRYAFPSYRNLMAHMKRAIEGFQVAVSRVAQVTAQDIR